jgi:hypothetical protein
MKPLLWIALLLVAGRAQLPAQEQVVIDFVQAEITGRWIESWEDKGVVFAPAQAPT